jgi:hypothetical protein
MFSSVPPDPLGTPSGPPPDPLGAPSGPSRTPDSGPLRASGPACGSKCGPAPTVGLCERHVPARFYVDIYLCLCRFVSAHLRPGPFTRPARTRHAPVASSRAGPACTRTAQVQSKGGFGGSNVDMARPLRACVGSRNDRRFVRRRFSPNFRDTHSARHALRVSCTGCGGCSRAHGGTGVMQVLRVVCGWRAGVVKGLRVACTDRAGGVRVA